MRSDVAVVGARGAARVRAGHPWVFRQDVVRGPERDALDGGPALVTVNDGRGKTIGAALWAARARLALRMVQHGDGPAPASIQDLVSARLDQALARRAALALDRDALRLVHGESDGLPGLFVDRYGDACVVQTASVAMDALLPWIGAQVESKLGARIVIERNDGSARDFEGLARRAGVLRGGGSTEVVYRLGPNRFATDVLAGSKTGAFLDQADNHAHLARLAPEGARCLDAFTHHGGFALALARRGGDVRATDADADAAARCADNARRNELQRVHVQRADAFDLLRELEASGERFDVVVLDPPALAKRGQAVAQREGRLAAADRGYRELLLRGFRLTAPGGLLCACSCSGAVTRAHWDELCAAASAQAGRPAQVVARLGAGADHPELATLAETGHLKCWILRVLDERHAGDRR